MKIQSMAAALVLAITVGTVALTPAWARSMPAGKSYGCQINPNAAGCQTAPKVQSANNGSVNSVSAGNAAPASGTNALPLTGGAPQPTPTADGLGASLAGFLFALLGLGVRRFARRG